MKIFSTPLSLDKKSQDKNEDAIEDHLSDKSCSKNNKRETDFQTPKSPQSYRNERIMSNTDSFKE